MLHYVTYWPIDRPDMKKQNKEEVKKIDIRCVKLALLREYVMSLKKDDPTLEAVRRREIENEIVRATQNSFARFVEVDATNYCKYETGNKIPGYVILSRVAVKCKVELEYFANKQSPADAIKFFHWRDWIHRLYHTTNGAEVFASIPIATDALELKDRINNKTVNTDHQISEELFEANE